MKITCDNIGRNKTGKTSVVTGISSPMVIVFFCGYCLFFCSLFLFIIIFTSSLFIRFSFLQMNLFTSNVMTTYYFLIHLLYGKQIYNANMKNDKMQRKTIGKTSLCQFFINLSKIICVILQLCEKEEK